MSTRKSRTVVLVLAVLAIFRSAAVAAPGAIESTIRRHVDPGSLSGVPFRAFIDFIDIGQQVHITFKVASASASAKATVRLEVHSGEVLQFEGPLAVTEVGGHGTGSLKWAKRRSGAGGSSLRFSVMGRSGSSTCKLSWSGRVLRLNPASLAWRGAGLRSEPRRETSAVASRNLTSGCSRRIASVTLAAYAPRAPEAPAAEPQHVRFAPMPFKLGGMQILKISLATALLVSSPLVAECDGTTFGRRNITYTTRDAVPFGFVVDLQSSRGLTVVTVRVLVSEGMPDTEGAARIRWNGSSGGTNHLPYSDTNGVRSWAVELHDFMYPTAEVELTFLAWGTFWTFEVHDLWANCESSEPSASDVPPWPCRIVGGPAEELEALIRSEPN